MLYPKHAIKLVASESFRVYRKITADQIPRNLTFSPSFQKAMKVPGVLIYVTRAVTSDRCYYDKYTLNGPSEAYISENKNSAWRLIGSFGSISLEACQRQLINDNWRMLPLIELRKMSEKTVKPKYLIPSRESPIYQDFTPEALLRRQVEREEPLLEQEPVKVEVRQHVKPVITHVPHDIEVSIEKLKLYERDEDLKRRILERKEKLSNLRKFTHFQRKKLKEPAGEKPLFSKSSPDPKFKTKQDMIDYIRNRRNK